MFNPTIEQQNNLKIWIAALRSGNFTQTAAALERITNEGKEYCCLGIVCRTFPIRVVERVVLASSLISSSKKTEFGFIDYNEYKSSSILPTKLFNDLFSFEENIMNELIAWNDWSGPSHYNKSWFGENFSVFEHASFADIADMLEDYLIACEVLNNDS